MIPFPFVVLFNGPPRCGKDTAAEMLAAELASRGVYVGGEKFARPLKDGAVALYRALGFAPVLTVEEYDAGDKDAPRPEFDGKSWRQVLIALSETYVKPTHGVDSFGRLFVARTHRWLRQVLIVSDSGFAAEVAPVVKAADLQRCLIVRLHRRGCDFANDSRSWLEVPGVRTIDLFNDGDLVGLRAQIREHVLPLVPR